MCVEVLIWGSCRGTTQEIYGTDAWSDVEKHVRIFTDGGVKII
jgi:hypothetical protein